MADALRAGLADVPGVTVHDIGREKGGIVSFAAAGIDPATLKARLREDAINYSTSTVTSTRIDMTRRGIEVVNRASVHYYNTEDEVERFCRAVARFAT